MEIFKEVRDPPSLELRKTSGAGVGVMGQAGRQPK